MLALKDIIADEVGTSSLASSPLWAQPVDQIIPEQIFAFIDRLAQLGQRDQAESAVEIAMVAVQKAVAGNVLPVPPMLAYKRSNRVSLTSNEVKDGLLFLGTPKAPAVLFALEMGMTLQEVARLTHRAVATLRQSKSVTPVAEECLASAPPRHLSLQYVFWQQSESGFPLPLFGLDMDVFDAFGLVWAELVEGYANMH